MSSWGNRIMTMGFWFFALLLTQWSCVFFFVHIVFRIFTCKPFLWTKNLTEILSCMNHLRLLWNPFGVVQWISLMIYLFLDMAFGLHCIQNVLNLIGMIVSRSFSCSTGVLGFWEEKNYPEEHRCFWHFWNVSPPRKELTRAKNESIETFSFYEKRLEY